jgi:putative transposase
MNKDSYVLEYVTCEFIHFDFVLVDDNRGELLGRPWCCIIYDVYSKLILGIHIGFTLPSAEMVIRALKNAVLPKDYIKERYPSVVNKWKGFGIPKTLCVDNGQEFKSKHLEKICLKLDIELFYTATLRSEAKAEMERFFKTINEALYAKVMSNNKFLEFFHLWVVDVYSNSYQKSLKGIPNEIWEQSVKNF